MNMTKLVRGVSVALALTTGGATAFAQGDIYSRLFEMRQMDSNKDGMVSKAEFLAMAAKAWDMKSAEMKVKGPLNEEQLHELMKVLGRSVGGGSGS